MGVCEVKKPSSSTIDTTRVTHTKKPKKEWWEYTQAEKDRIERWIAINVERGKRRYAEQSVRERHRAMRKRDKIYMDRVSVIHWVSDPPDKLAQRFIEWRAKK
jgi:hypothetical protein